MTDSFVFDLIEKFNASTIVSLDYANGDSHIVLKKKDACVFSGADSVFGAIGATSPAASGTVDSAASGVLAGAASAKAEVPAAAKTAATSSGASSGSSENAAGATGDATETVDSPIVGTFYRSPSPDSPAYAEKGTTIKKGEPLCIIEAMKMMNTLTAEFDMEIVEVLVENGSLAEYGQPLFKVKRV